MRGILILFFVSLFTGIFAQDNSIVIDGHIGEWMGLRPMPNLYEDKRGENPYLDFVQFSVTNDFEYLYICMEVDREIRLLDSPGLFLYIDADNNPQTGLAESGLGAEIAINLGNKEAELDISPLNGKFNLNKVGFYNMPTVSSKIHEIAIRRVALFQSTDIKILFKDGGENGDLMPGKGESFVYTLKNTPSPPVAPIPLEKNNTEDVRVMTFNVLNDGLNDPNRKDAFKRILQSSKPDMITFNECWETTPDEVEKMLNEWLPVTEPYTWQASKMDEGNITASCFPFIQHWQVYDGSRITASMIDLPPEYVYDMLLINSHFACCDKDIKRQNEADAIISFLLDARGPGGKLQLPQNTPIILSGDFNMVGDAQQLRTLLEGQIINSDIYGLGNKPDWDQTGLVAVEARQSDNRMSFTWRSDEEQFPPGRLDYIIYSNSNLETQNSFVLNTETMSEERLTQYSLQKNDTRNASDHLPLIADFDVPMLTFLPEDEEFDQIFELFREPYKDTWTIQLKERSEPFFKVSLLENSKKRIWKAEGANQILLKIDQIPEGEHLLKAEIQGKSYLKKVIRK